MGIEPYLVAATVQGIMAQRLVRVVCGTCRGQSSLDRSGALVHGCENCSRTGFDGRTGIFELLSMTEELRALIVGRATLDDVRAVAKRDGMSSLYEDGMRKAEAGVTTLDEVLRVTGEAEPRRRDTITAPLLRRGM
jgi:general secretion pathway protein E